MNSSQSISKLAAALLKAQKSMGDATKYAKNPFFRSTYADLNSIREVAIPALNAQGVGVFQPTVVQGTTNYVETLLLHESGEWMSSLTEIKNIKGDAQGEGSGISYSRRYGLQSILNIGAVDDDGEAAVGRKVNDVPQVSARAPETNKSTALPRPEASAPKVEAQKSVPEVTAKVPTTKRLSEKDLVKLAYKILNAKFSVSEDTFRTTYLEGKNLNTLSAPQLKTAIELLKKDYKNELPL